MVRQTLPALQCATPKRGAPVRKAKARPPVLRNNTLPHTRHRHGAHLFEKQKLVRRCSATMYSRMRDSEIVSNVASGSTSVKFRIKNTRNGNSVSAGFCSANRRPAVYGLKRLGTCVGFSANLAAEKVPRSSRPGAVISVTTESAAEIGACMRSVQPCLQRRDLITRHQFARAACSRADTERRCFNTGVYTASEGTFYCDLRYNAAQLEARRGDGSRSLPSLLLRWPPAIRSTGNVWQATPTQWPNV